MLELNKGVARVSGDRLGGTSMALGHRFFPSSKQTQRKVMAGNGEFRACHPPMRKVWVEKRSNPGSIAVIPQAIHSRNLPRARASSSETASAGDLGQRLGHDIDHEAQLRRVACGH